MQQVYASNSQKAAAFTIAELRESFLIDPLCILGQIELVYPTTTAC